MKYTNRADLLIAAGESIKMQEKAGVCPVCKENGSLFNARNHPYNHLDSEFEFPLAVVESKPVFVGDELYWKEDGDKLNWLYFCPSWNWYNLSWNPPKPNTVMVKLLREDAQHIAGMGLSVDGILIGLECRKALEKP